VLLRARLIAGIPRSLISSLTAIVDGHLPVAGDGPLTTRAIWVKPPQAPAKSVSATPAATRRAGSLPAPSPVRLAASAASVTRPVVAGASVTAAPGASLLAVQNAEIVRTGRDRELGRFIQLRDVVGDTYTYGRLGSVASRYAVAGSPVTSAAGRRVRPSGRGRPVRFAPLRIGAWVPAGTVIGRVQGGASAGSAQFLFEVRPAGAGRLDTRPLHDAGELLGKTLRGTGSTAKPLFGPDAPDALISEILPMSRSQLERRLLSDPDARISACGRRAIAAGKVDRRVLSVLEFLVASGAAPTVSGFVCGGGAASAPAAKAARANGDAVAISAIDGLSIRGHHAPGSVTDLVIRRLLTLRGAIRPLRIVSPIGVRGAPAGLVTHGSPDHMEIEFAPPASARASAARTPFCFELRSADQSCDQSSRGPKP